MSQEDYNRYPRSLREDVELCEEAGVDFVTMYPGCPSAEIGDEFGKILARRSFGKGGMKDPNANLPFYYEISTNEKVAL
jgi:TPP-dependent indolepyruvate ferredoxin oxidoreductase alpha subunit